MSQFIDITGHRFSRLVAIKLLPERSPQGRTLWECKCDCGKTVAVSSNALRRGNTQSCGCLARSLTASRSTKHGKANSPEYAIWAAMRNRCTNPNDRNYKNYGGRGITLCERWQAFPSFYADMGSRPSSRHSIERLDNNGHYSPDNCKWATVEEQQLNRRTARLLTFKGETCNLAIWAKRTGLSVTCILHRLNAGWTVARALTEPSTSPMIRNQKLLTLKGESLPIAEWARRTGINRATIQDRLYAGWSVEEALTTPPRFHVKSRQ